MGNPAAQSPTAPSPSTLSTYLPTCGIRTMFTALHHFRPPQARGILEDAARKGSGIAVFEPLSRSPRMALGYGVAGIARG
jgi:hypothetical protein